MTAWEPGANNRRIYLPRGRMLGGSSSMNAMIYIRGNRADYDEWAAQGATGWGYDDLLPYFKRAEDNERGAERVARRGRPAAGLRGPRAHATCADFLEAADAFGLPANPDFNAREQDGVGWYQVTQRDGRRASAAVAYLHPAMTRPNLEVLTGCYVLKVLFEARARSACRRPAATTCSTCAPSARSSSPAARTTRRSCSCSRASAARRSSRCCRSRPSPSRARSA